MAKHVKVQKRSSVFEPVFSEKLRMILLGVFIGAFVWWLVYRSLYFLPVAPAAAVFVYFLKKRERIDEKKREFANHFAEYVKALHTAMRSGYSLENAAENACFALKDLYGEDALICRETARICNGLKVSRTAEEMFGDMAERCRLPDVALFAELTAISKRSGGDMGKLLSDTSRILDEKADTESLIQEQLAGKRMEHRVMSLMPALMILYMRLCFSGFTEVLYGTETGVLVMTVSLAVYVAAYVWGLRMVNIRV